MPVELKEIKRKRARLISDARVINDLVITEGRVMNEEEQTRFTTLTTEADSLQVDIERTERLDTLERSLSESNGEQRGGNMLPHNEPRNLGKYSVLRAIREMADQRVLSGLEGEVSQELAKKRAAVTGRPLQANAFIMPLDLPVDLRAARRGRMLYGTAEQRAFDTTAGVGGIPTILSTDYITLLRARLVIEAAGARILTDLSGLFAIPRQSAASTAYWVGEGVPVTGSQPIVDQCAFTPKTVGAYTDITRRLAEQLSTDAEQFVREDLAAVVARGVDSAALNGSGVGAEPRGILQNPAVPTVAVGTNGGPASWNLIVALETALGVANSDIGKLAYVTNAKVRGACKTIPMVNAPSFPFFLWNINTPGTPLNSYPAYVTNLIPSNFTKGTAAGVCSGMIFGNWDDLVLAIWGAGQDVIVDPYTGSAAGTIRVVTLEDCDVNVRHPESFSKSTDITTP